MRSTILVIGVFVSLVSSAAAQLPAEGHDRLRAVQHYRAGVEFLTIRMEGEHRDQSVRSIELVPDLQDATILNAVHSYFMN